MACTCFLSECCCSPSSYSKHAQIVSVLDMIMSVVFITYETANFGLLTGLIKEDKNCSINCTAYIENYMTRHEMITNFNFKTFTVVTMIMLIFVGFIIEGSLYSKLKSGKRLRVHLYVKKWFEWRVVLLFITVFMAVAKVLRGLYSPYFDGIIDGVTKSYRIITLFIVKCFMEELEVTVGTVYVKPPKPRKRGSLSLK